MKTRITLIFFSLIFMNLFISHNVIAQEAATLNSESIELINVESIVSKEDMTLTYIITIKNNREQPLKTYDYPGWQHLMLQVNIIPKQKLAQLMEMVEDTKYKKMVVGSASSNVDREFIPGQTFKFEISYKIKNGSDLKKVKENVYDGTLLILNGPELLKKIKLT